MDYPPRRKYVLTDKRFPAPICSLLDSNFDKSATPFSYWILHLDGRAFSSGDNDPFL